mgnify:CR=1 FL=1
MAPSILNPLLEIALRASLFEDKILFFEIKSKILIPFSTSSDLIFISGRPELSLPRSKVSLAVFSASFEAISP